MLNNIRNSRKKSGPSPTNFVVPTAPQYRRVMLPMIVLRRLDCVLEPTKDEVLKQFVALKKKDLSDAAVEKALAKIASKHRHQPLYNVSLYTFTKLIGDADGLAKNLTAYIKGFSPKVSEIFEKFEFEKLNEANRLFAETAAGNETLKAAAQADTLDNFKHVFDRMLERFFVDRMEGNEEIFDRIMNDPAFRNLASAHARGLRAAAQS